MPPVPEEQPALPIEAVREVVRRTPAPAARSTVEPAEVDPVARVLVDLPLAHLDRPFDYLVPATMAETAVPGARVKVRFAGQDVDGFVLERVAESDHPGRLQPLRRAVSAEPVLTPQVAELTAAVAQRYAGTRSDVLRLAVPSRHARVEKTESPVRELPQVASDDRGDWSAHAGGPEFLAALAAGEPARGVLGVLPGDDPMERLVDAVVATAAAGRGSLVCVPDQRDLARLDAALTARIGADRHVVLLADAGPAARYRAFLAAARGACRIVIGTRAAAFAPVADLGLVAMWDDGDDLFADPRAPYPHAREVLLTRAAIEGIAFLAAAHSRSVEAHYLVRTGWAVALDPARDELRSRVTVAVTAAHDLALERDPLARAARLPREAFALIREALADGPVLLQAPRAGYVNWLVCEGCRTPATCAACHGPLRVTGRDQPPTCAWCATVAAPWQCPECGHRGLRTPAPGEGRTAEELGRAFPGVAVRRSARDHVLPSVPGSTGLVVATPGAEPPAEGGYAAVVLLDTWLLTGRPDWRADEEALRRWLNAAGLVRPGGRVLAVGDAAHPALQALVRWDPAGLAEREIAERQEAHLPPASRMATLTGTASDLESGLPALERPPGTEVLGPVPVGDDDEQRFVVRVPRGQGAALSAALRGWQAGRSARKLPHVRVQVDPTELV